MLESLLKFCSGNTAIVFRRLTLPETMDRCLSTHSPSGTSMVSSSNVSASRMYTGLRLELWKVLVSRRIFAVRATPAAVNPDSVSRFSSWRSAFISAAV